VSQSVCIAHIAREASVRAGLATLIGTRQHNGRVFRATLPSDREVRPVRQEACNSGRRGKFLCNSRN
jgi:hypothetical protein